MKHDEFVKKMFIAMAMDERPIKEKVRYVDECFEELESSARMSVETEEGSVHEFLNLCDPNVDTWTPLVEIFRVYKTWEFNYPGNDSNISSEEFLQHAEMCKWHEAYGSRRSTKHGAEFRLKLVYIEEAEW